MAPKGNFSDDLLKTGAYAGNFIAFYQNKKVYVYKGYINLTFTKYINFEEISKLSLSYLVLYHKI